MPSLVLPGWVKASLENEDVLDRQVGSARYIDRALRAKDPNLRLVFVKPDVAEWDLPLGAVAGRWHVEVRSETFVSAYIPIVGRNGEYREPDVEGVLRLVGESDLHKPDIYRDKVEASQRRMDARKKASELEAEQHRHDMTEDFRAGKRLPGEGGFEKKSWGKG